MKKLVLGGAIAIVAVVLLVLALSSLYVLDSQKLEAAIKKDLPPGTPKAQVIQFIKARKPLFWDDLGTHVKARMSGLAANLIYRKDIVLDCKFDPDGRLLACSKNEYLTFF
jgi:hypothetical protein